MPALLLLARLCEPTAGEDKSVMERHDYATYKMRAVAAETGSEVLAVEYFILLFFSHSMYNIASP
jgi:hypothetical protein